MRFVIWELNFHSTLTFKFLLSEILVPWKCLFNYAGDERQSNVVKRTIESNIFHFLQNRKKNESFKHNVYLNSIIKAINILLFVRISSIWCKFRAWCKVLCMWYNEYKSRILKGFCIHRNYCFCLLFHRRCEVWGAFEAKEIPLKSGKLKVSYYVSARTQKHTHTHSLISFQHRFKFHSRKHHRSLHLIHFSTNLLLYAEINNGMLWWNHHRNELEIHFNLIQIHLTIINNFVLLPINAQKKK